MVVWLQESKKRTAFQYSLFVAALALVGMLQYSSAPTDSVKRLVYENIASVIGVSGAVLPNQFNVLAQQLAQKDLELSSREREIIERERLIGEEYQSAIMRNQQTVFYAISAVALLLLLLILLNFYLDYAREKREHAAGVGKTHLGELQTRL